ncbi:MAG: LytTR family DNA-binding domain-containing protein [Ignavibacteria bacterium]|jgi:two-component system response regulator LytT
MRILIVEDESLVAKRIKRLTEQALVEKNISIVLRSTLESASAYLDEHPIDLLLLDLNLSGKDGFEILKNVVSESFHTIIISANTDKALEAFEYGVLDFIGKPFTLERLQKAFERIEKAAENASYPAKYLSVKQRRNLHVININEICYIKGSGGYSELHLHNGNNFLHNKSLDNLGAILPSYFVRVHRSYLVNIRYTDCFRSHSGSKYDLLMKNKEVIPVSRNRYKQIKEIVN